MKKIFVIMFFAFHIGCEFNHEKHDPLMDIVVGEKTDYSWDNNIEITWHGDAMVYIATSFNYINDKRHYWQLPEETFEIKRGDCADLSIFFMFLLKTKLNLETSMIIIDSGYSQHALVYPIRTSVGDLYYDAQYNYMYQKIPDGWHIESSIPYFEVMWMTFYYHRNVGIYY